MDHPQRYRDAVATLVLRSPRLRRRLTWGAAIAAVVAALAAAAVLLPSRSPALADEAPVVDKPAMVVAEPPTVAPPRRAISALLARFVPAVIARRDLAAGWELVTPDARGARAAWLRGETPFPSFPAARDTRFDGWTVNYSYPKSVGFDIFVSPTDPDKQVSMSFRGEARKVGGAWRIAVFYPQATYQPIEKPAFVWADTDLAPGMTSGAAAKARLSPLWFLVPVGIFGVALVGGVGFALVRWARRASRVREIERMLESTR